MPEPTDNCPEISEMIQRVFRLKNKLNAGTVPENLVFLGQLAHDSRLVGKSGVVNDFDLFYNTGIVLSRHKTPITMGELSRELGISLSTATRMMDWLVNNNYAQRLPDTLDRRVVRVALTSAGQDIFIAINQFFMERIERLMSKLTAQERETFLVLLHKILGELEQGNL